MASSDKRPKGSGSVCILQFDIITSPEELAKGGECYRTLQKKLTLPFQPFIGLRLVVNPAVSEDEEEKYLLLSRNVQNNKGYFNVAKITYYMGDLTLKLHAQNLFEQNLKSFRDCEEFHVSFLGFRRL